MDKIEIKETHKIIIAERAMLNDSSFHDVAMINLKISNANLTNLVTNIVTLKPCNEP